MRTTTTYFPGWHAVYQSVSDASIKTYLPVGERYVRRRTSDTIFYIFRRMHVLLLSCDVRIRLPPLVWFVFSLGYSSTPERLEPVL